MLNERAKLDAEREKNLHNELRNDFEDARNIENHASIVSDILGRQMTFMESRAFLIHLVTTNIPSPLGQDIVLSSWGLLRGTDHIFGKVNRRIELIRLLNLNCSHSNILKKENRLYKPLIKFCRRFKIYPDSVDSYLEKVFADEQACSTELPLPRSFLHPTDQQEDSESHQTTDAFADDRKLFSNSFYQQTETSLEDLSPYFRDFDLSAAQGFEEKNDMYGAQLFYYKYIYETLCKMSSSLISFPESWQEDRTKRDYLDYFNCFYGRTIKYIDVHQIRQYFTYRHQIVQLMLNLNNPEADKEIISFEQKFYNGIASLIGGKIIIRLPLNHARHKETGQKYLFIIANPPGAKESVKEAFFSFFFGVDCFLDNDFPASELPELFQSHPSWWAISFPKDYPIPPELIS